MSHTDTTVVLSVSQPIGSADRFLLTSRPPLQHPTLGLVGSQWQQAAVIVEEIVHLENLSKYALYMFKACKLFTSLLSKTVNVMKLLNMGC